MWLGPHRSPGHPAHEISAWTYLHTHVSGVREERAGGVLGLSWVLPTHPIPPAPRKPQGRLPLHHGHGQVLGPGPGLLTQQAASLPAQDCARCWLGELFNPSKRVSGHPGAPGTQNTLPAVDVRSGHVPGAQQAPDPPAGLQPDHRGLSPPLPLPIVCCLVPAGTSLPCPLGPCLCTGPPGGLLLASRPKPRGLDSTLTRSPRWAGNADEDG